MNSYVILFSLDALIGADGKPEPGAATVYNMITIQSFMMGHAIKKQNIEAETPFVDIFADKPETDRDQIMTWLKANDFELPRALRLGNDPLGTDRILAVFDNDPARVETWRGAGAACFAGNRVPKIVLQS